VKGPTSGRCHPAKKLPGSEEVFEPLVVTHDPVNNPPTAAHRLSNRKRAAVKRYEARQMFVSGADDALAGF